MASMNIRDAAALHQEALDLRSFLTLKEVPSKTDCDEPRSPSPTNSPRSGVVLFDPTILRVDTFPILKEEEEEMENQYSNNNASVGPRRRRSFHLQLDCGAGTEDNDASNNQRSHDQEDDDEENQEEETPEDRMRHNVIDEICSTENSYVAAIRTLHDYYIVPLEDNKHPIMEDAQIAVFFNNVRQIVMLNSKLRNDLTDIVDKRRRGVRAPLASPVFLKHSLALAASTSSLNSNGGGQSSAGSSPNRSMIHEPSEGIGAVFCRYAPLFKLYGGFAKDYEEVAQLLQGYKRDARLGFEVFLETCRVRSGSDESFESLLIKPIQRIPRYKLLLERICEFTPSGHRDELFLREAVSRVTDAASLINETVRDHENLESVLATQKQFAGQLALVTADRRLLRSGKLTKMSTKRHEEVTLHLFNDILVYSGVLITGGYRVRRVVQLTSKAVGVRTQLPATHHSLFQHRNLRYDCGFVVTSLEKTFVLFAASPDERQVWIDSITSAIDAAQKKQALSPTSSLDTPADAAALWVPDAVVGSCKVCHAAFKVYFRRHHCRRCGGVVCGNCSAKRSILFVGDSSREERVCSPCHTILHLVKLAAFKWLSLVVQFKGTLRRKRWGKWSDHYFELKAGILKQYTLASATGSNTKCCTDTLNLTGAIVIHRSDERSLKNRFCFQISTSDGHDLDVTPVPPLGQSTTAPSASPQGGGGGNGNGNGRTSNAKKLSPLKAAASRAFGFDPSASRHRGSTVTTLSSEGSGSHLALSSSSRVQDDRAGWVLCATSHSDEVQWTDAIQRSADRALLRSRRSRVTECSFPVPFERGNSVPSSLGKATAVVPPPVETESVFGNEKNKVEQRRHQIMKEIVRAEESYVTCLGECIRGFVQPLLLRQLEAQKLLRRKQSKRKKSFLHSLGGSGSNALNAAAVLAQRKCSHTNLTSLPSARRLVSSSSSRSMPHPSDASRGAIGISSSSSQSGAKMLVLDADMAIFFSSIDQICTLNQQLLDHLSRHVDDVKRDESDDREYRPGAIFSAYAPLFQLYTAYASRHQAALAAIASPQFVEFLKEIQGDAGAHRLCTYLNMPMERIPRYRVFLQELLDSTPPDHIDYAPLQSALKSVEQVTTKLKEIIARRESARKVEEVSKTVGMDLRGKRFVLDGMLQKVCRKKVQQYYFVLLEDVLVYGRLASGLHKKKFRLIELSEAKVSDDSESIPRAVNHATGCAKSNNAFYFFSPLKSFILIAESQEDKLKWMHSVQESIDRTLRCGPRRSSRRASIRSELLLDEEDISSEYELENAIVIKNGWLNVIKRNQKTSRRLWITLNMQTLSMSMLFKSAQLEDTISIGLCEAVPMNEPTFFRVYVCTESMSVHTVDRTAYTFETQTAAECEEWLRALHHCISGSGASDLMEMRRRSLSSSAIHAPILLFNQVSSVCMICLHSFAVYRRRHHCRLCGNLVCGHCSKRKWTLTYGTSKKASRICDGCAEAATVSASSLVSEL